MAAGAPFPAAALRAALEARAARPLLASHLLSCGPLRLRGAGRPPGLRPRGGSLDHLRPLRRAARPDFGSHALACTANADFRQGIAMPTADLARWPGWSTEDIARITATAWTTLALATTSVRQRVLRHRHKKRYWRRARDQCNYFGSNACTVDDVYFNPSSGR